MKPKRYAAYCAIFETESDKNTSQVVITSGSLSGMTPSIKDALKGESASERDIDETYENCETEETIADVGLNLYHFLNQLKKYYELSFIGSNLSSVFEKSYFRNVIEKKAKTSYEAVKSVHGQTIYGLDEHQLIGINRDLERLSDISRGVASFMPAVLLSIVASYDSLFSDLTKNLLNLRPERYQSSDRQYSVSELLEMGSFEQLTERVISDEVDSLMNRSHVDQISFFEKSFSVDVQKYFSRWPEYVEIFERRNLAAHGGLCINERYLSNCKKNGFDTSGLVLGQPLVVDRAYINQCLDVLIELGTTLVFAAWLKQITTQRNEAFQAIVSISYDLLKSRRYKISENVISFALNGYEKHASELIRKMLKVNKAIALKKQKMDDEANAIIDQEDWTASSPMFQICISALKEDEERFLELLPNIKATGEISAKEFRDWPVFDWIRRKSIIQEKFLDIFGTRINAEQKLKNVSEKSAEISGTE